MNSLVIIELSNRLFSLDKGDALRTGGSIDELLKINFSTQNS